MILIVNYLNRSSVPFIFRMPRIILFFALVHSGIHPSKSVDFTHFFVKLDQKYPQCIQVYPTI